LNYSICSNSLSLNQTKIDLFNNGKDVYGGVMRSRKKSKKELYAKEVRFKRLYGVKPATFHKMLLILQKEFEHSKEFK
ncbi:MAG: hypothetical protein LBP87_00765, partial [Planctomycetaceae bacterium]|nr:hypothetical protein [Planctomycetaceae bacterium]